MSDSKAKKPQMVHPVMEPCPFCGDNRLQVFQAEQRDGTADWWVYCRGCQSTGPVMRDSLDAILEWNNRRG